MKKITAIITALLLAALCVSAIVSVSAAPTAESVKLDSKNGEIALRDGADISLLCDGNKLFSADGIADFN